MFIGVFNCFICHPIYYFGIRVDFILINWRNKSIEKIQAAPLKWERFTVMLDTNKIVLCHALTLTVHIQ